MTVSTIRIILGLMSLASALVSWLQKRQQIQAGYDQAIAKAAADILLSTETGKVLRDQVRAATDSDADKLWEDMLNA